MGIIYSLPFSLGVSVVQFGEDVIGFTELLRILKKFNNCQERVYKHYTH